MTIKDYPLLPVRNSFFFPGSTSVLHVGRPSSVKALRAALARPDHSLALLIQKDPLTEKPGIEHLHPIGVRTVIREAKEQDGTFQVVVESQERIKLRDLSQIPFPIAQVELLADQMRETVQGPDLHTDLLTLSTLLLQMSGANGVSAAETAASLDNPYELISFLATVLPLSLEEGITLLQAEHLEDGQRQILQYLSHHIRLAEEKKSLPWAIRKVSWSAPEMESVVRANSDDEDIAPNSATAFRKFLRESRLPHHIRSAVSQVVERLERAEADSLEHQSALMTLEYFFELPWGIVTLDNLDPSDLLETLDQNLLGLEAAKTQILERVCLDRLGTESRGVINFCGPLGSGKRSTVEELAKALGRKIEFLRLPNDDSLSELSGRLWNGTLAGPGRLYEAMRNAGCQNPILVFQTDELTEAQLKLLVGLTQEGGAGCQDDFLGLPLDFSECAIIVLSTSTEGLPEYLLETCQIVSFRGYTNEEKKVLARQHLLPKLLDYAGLEEKAMLIPDNVLNSLVESRSHERGVAGVNLALNILVGKVALHRSQGFSSPLLCTEELVSELLRTLPSHDFDDETVAGQTRTLAATTKGTQIVEIESLVLVDSKTLVTTGLSGPEIEDTALLAKSLISTRGRRFGFGTEGQGLHLHLPNDVHKSNHSDLGLAIAVSMASAYLACPVRPGTVVLGELRLTGGTVASAGLEEKILAAKDVGLRRLVLPLANKEEFLRLPQSITETLEVLFVKDIDEALIAALPELGL